MREWCILLCVSRKIVTDVWSLKSGRTLRLSLNNSLNVMYPFTDKVLCHYCKPTHVNFPLSLILIRFCEHFWPSCPILLLCNIRTYIRDSYTVIFICMHARPPTDRLLRNWSLGFVYETADAFAGKWLPPNDYTLWKAFYHYANAAKSRGIQVYIQTQFKPRYRNM